LLVPSVSSAGFRDTAIDVAGETVMVPEPWQWLLTAGTTITEALLISAYDLHYGYLPDTDQLASEYHRTRYSEISLVFIDSGLYEKIHGPPPHSGVREDWNLEMLAGLLDSLDEICTNAVVVNYDFYDEGNGSFGDQVAAARRFFKERPRFASDFLIKPERSGTRFDRQVIAELAPHMRDMADFDVIGVTEKDLGDTLLDRLTHLAWLRDELTRAGIERPIHVFGSLDPLFTPLYFAAGGEIFDGLTWMRYGFERELSVYREAVPLLQTRQNLREPPVVRATRILSANLKHLGGLAQAMRDFAAAGGTDWRLFGDSVAPHLEAAHRAMLTTLKEG
jgi:hypothetical protein